MRNRRKDLSEISPKANFLLHAFFILYSAVCVLPFLLILAISVSDENSILLHGYKILPEHFSLAAYRFLLSDTTALIRSYGITIYATVAGTVAGVLITVLFAYPLSRKDFKYRNVFAFIVFFTMIFHGGLVPGYMVYTQLLHLKNSLLVYIFPHLMSAWYVIIMRTFLATSLPDSIIEAAKIDGAGEWKIFMRIVLPLSLPGIATIALFLSIGLWNDWNTPLLYITQPKLYNLQFSMYSVLQNAQYLKENASSLNENIQLDSIPTETVRMAMCIAAIGPVIFAYPFFQKYFVRGLTVGAVKG